MFSFVDVANCHLHLQGLCLVSDSKVLMRFFICFVLMLVSLRLMMSGSFPLN